MGFTTYPAPAGGKTRYNVTLQSGTSWTVPAGVTYISATLVGGGGTGGTGWISGTSQMDACDGSGGQVRTTTFNTTPGAAITYAIGAAGGNTTMTGATTANAGNFGAGGNGGGGTGTDGLASRNGGQGATASYAGGSGGTGVIFIEYWA